MYENKRMMKTWFAFMKYCSKKFDHMSDLQNYAIALNGGEVHGIPDRKSSQVPMMALSTKDLTSMDRSSIG